MKRARKQKIVAAILAKHDTATHARRFNTLLATASIDDAIEYDALFQSITSAPAAPREYGCPQISQIDADSETGLVESALATCRPPCRMDFFLARRLDLRYLCGTVGVAERDQMKNANIFVVYGILKKHID